MGENVIIFSEQTLFAIHDEAERKTAKQNVIITEHCLSKPNHYGTMPLVLCAIGASCSKLLTIVITSVVIHAAEWKKMHIQADRRE